MYYYYDAMIERADPIGQCNLFIYKRLDCVIIEYRDCYRGMTKPNGEYSRQFADAIVKLVPTTYNIEFVDRKLQLVKLLNVYVHEFLLCINIFIDAGFSIQRDDNNSNVTISKSIHAKGEFRRMLEHLNDARFPEDKIHINCINDLY